MKKLAVVSFVVAVLMSLMALAQYTTKQDNTKASAQEKQEQKAASQTKTVTGCLQKGSEPGEFSITGGDGKTWGLRSSTVKLDEHVGHTVAVTGPITHE
jgi:membrane protein implicated in regulation of membrane protease activity